MNESSRSYVFGSLASSSSSSSFFFFLLVFAFFLAGSSDVVFALAAFGFGAGLVAATLVLATAALVVGGADAGAPAVIHDGSSLPPATGAEPSGGNDADGVGTDAGVRQEALAVT
jgi:hypothetical protein